MTAPTLGVPPKTHWVRWASNHVLLSALLALMSAVGAHTGPASERTTITSGFRNSLLNPQER
jgi:hypothetical protein